MNMKLVTYISAIFFLLLQTATAQVQFEAKVSKTTLGINERLRIDFTMNDDGDNFEPPNFDACGFKVVAGPSQQVSQSWINGRSSFSKTYSYFLIPKSRGTLTIKQASIEIRGQIYKTSPVRITVTAAVELPKDPNYAPQVSVNDAIHLVAEVSKNNPYINEPITVVYKLYISYDIGVKSWRELDKPKYNDFWSQNIDIKELRAEDGNYNGEKMRYVVLRKTVLYPQKSGKLMIEPLSLDIDVQLPSNRRNFFGQVLLIDDSKRVSAGARTINVKPLPEAGKPENFNGAVGRFSFNAKPSKTTLNNGESLDLTVSVSGTGNLKLFTLPKPAVPSSLEMYDPVHSENVSTPLSGMTGSISDTYTIIPQFKGDYPIKPLTFSYFDPSVGKYKTISSAPFTIKVLDGPANASATASNGNEVQKQALTKTAQFKFIKLKTKLVNKTEGDFFGSTGFYSLMISPLLALPLLLLIRRRNKAVAADVVGNKTKNSNKLAKRFLSEAKTAMNDKERFYISLERALHNFLKAKLQIETSEMSKVKIAELLQNKNASIETTSALIRLIESCEFARYAPTSESVINADYETAVDLLNQLEKQIK